MNQTIKDVEDFLIHDLRVGIQLVVDDILDCYKNPFLSPSHVINELKNLEAIDLEEYDQNGWEMDNWSYFRLNNIDYCVAGSGYYGGIKFSKR